MAGDPQGGHPNTNPAPAPAANPTGLPAGFPSQNTRVGFAIALLQAIGAPETQQNIGFLVGWMGAEGTSAAFNPLATTEDSGDPRQTNFNGVGVKNYPDFQTGVAAEAKNLQGGRYNTIVSALRSGNPDAAFTAVDEFATYSGNAGNPSGAQHYIDNIRSGYQRYLGDPTAGTGTIGTTGAGMGTTGATTAGQRGVPSSLLLQYGFLQTEDPQAWALVQRAANDPNYFQNGFEADFEATAWYRATSGSARSWETEKNQDPATWEQQYNENLQNVIATAKNVGANLNPYQLGTFADQYGRFGWTQDDLTRALVTASKYMPGQQGGTLGSSMEQVRQSAANYGINLDDRQAYSYASNLVEGQNPAGVDATFANQAKALYPHLSAQLDQGLTLRDIAAPYITQAANLLEVDPTSISLTDPKFTAPLSVSDGKGSRQMTQQEWATTLMSNPAYGWDKTENARDTAVNITQQLAQTFGYAA